MGQEAIAAAIAMTTTMGNERGSKEGERCKKEGDGKEGNGMEENEPLRDFICMSVGMRQAGLFVNCGTLALVWMQWSTNLSLSYDCRHDWLMD